MAEPVETVPAPAPTMPRPDPRDPVARTERMALVAVLQYPQHVLPAFDDLGEDAFSVPAWRAVHAAIRAAGGVGVGRTLGGAGWVSAVHEQAGDAVSGMIDELAVAPLPEDREDVLGRFVADVVRAVQDLGLTRRIADAKSRLLRLDPGADPEGYRDAFTTLLNLEAERRTLRESA